MLWWRKIAEMTFHTGVTREVIFYGFRIRRCFIGFIVSGKQIWPINPYGV